MVTRTIATLGTDGILTTGQRPAGMHTPVRGEAFTGDGATVAFTLAHTPLYGVTAFVAGVRLEPSVAGAVLTFLVAPALAALIRVDYEWAG